MSKQATLKTLAGSRARVALIDADSVLYAVACGAEAKMSDPDEYIQLKDEGECLHEVHRRFEELVDQIEADDAIVCLSVTRSFRCTILPTYKANRAGLRKPTMLPRLRQLVSEKRKPFGVLTVPGLEADDVCGISSTALQKSDLREPIIVSIDKDMRSVPGLSWSWYGKSRYEEPVVIETSIGEADRMHMLQTLMGDPVDGYTGCPFIGRVKAALLLDGVKEVSQWWDAVVNAYGRKGLSADDALTQARVARILRDTDWNSERKEISLWVPPPTASRPSLPRSVISTISSGPPSPLDRVLH